jgi:hypothetical protein
MNTCAVTIPIYKLKLTKSELFNITTSIKNLNNFDIYIYAPESLNTEYYQEKFKAIKVIRFPDKFFNSIQEYSRLMLSLDFYNSFNKYTYILVCQPDAIALKPELQYWINQQYDYIGAPWPNGFEYTITSDFHHIPEGVKCKSFVGNGGFSLRKIDSCLELFKEFPSIRSEWLEFGHAEDLFFGFTSVLSKKFRIPNLLISALFSHETEPEYLFKLIGNQIPFGCHAYEKHAPEHWKTIINFEE